MASSPRRRRHARGHDARGQQRRVVDDALILATAALAVVGVGQEPPAPRREVRGEIAPGREVGAALAIERAQPVDEVVAKRGVAEVGRDVGRHGGYSTGYAKLPRRPSRPPRLSLPEQGLGCRAGRSQHALRGRRDGRAVAGGGTRLGLGGVGGVGHGLVDRRRRWRRGVRGGRYVGGGPDPNILWTKLKEGTVDISAELYRLSTRANERTDRPGSMPLARTCPVRS